MTDVGPRPSDAPKGGQRPWALYYSPLRYPGGKRKLAPFVRLLFEANDLVDGEYAEVYAGGASVALTLLFEEYARRIHINDLDRGVHAFWEAACTQTDELCRRVSAVPLDMGEWYRQRAVLESTNPDPIDLALATFYLNRTNRSGIITGGPIGGYDQRGTWKLDARFRRSDLTRRIEKVGRYASRISTYMLDADDFLDGVVPQLPAKSLVYLDPPYYLRSREELYANRYKPTDHARIAGKVAGLERPWIVTYDDVEPIRQLYAGHASIAYGLAYTAHARYDGHEIAFFSQRLDVPDVRDPTRLTIEEAGAYARTAFA